VPHDASDLYKRSVLEIAQDMFKSAMVVDGMFCVAYGCGETESSIFVDIGTVSSRICCINVDQPDEMNCLVIDSGAGEIERELLDMVTEEHEGLIITKEIVREWVHSHSYVGGHADEFKAELMLEDGSTKEIIITEELGLVSEYLVSDILSGLIKMLSTIDPVSRDKVRNNIHICGGGSKIQNIGGFMENELKELGGGKVSLVDDPAFAGAIGAWMLAEKMPLEFWGRASGQKNKIVGTIT
jgi:rod shape-determining protein MreB